MNDIDREDGAFEGEGFALHLHVLSCHALHSDVAAGGRLNEEQRV